MFSAKTTGPIFSKILHDIVAKIGLAVTEIFCRICRFLAVSSNKVQLLPSQSLGLLDRMSSKLYEIQSVSEWQCHKGDWPIFGI